MKGISIVTHWPPHGHCGYSGEEIQFPEFTKTQTNLVSVDTGPSGVCLHGDVLTTMAVTN